MPIEKLSGYATFSVIWPLVTFRKIFFNGSNDTSLKSLSCPGAEPIDCKRGKHTDFWILQYNKDNS
jgi:hypothetical protein